MRTYTFKTLLAPRLVRAFIMGSVAVTALGGCAMHQSNYGPLHADRKITVAETVERMELYVQETGLNLSALDQGAMGDFVAQYVQTGQGPLYLNLPVSSANGAGIAQAQDMIVHQLANMGLDASVLQMGQYRSDADTPAPVIVSYRRLSTTAIECEQGASLTHTGNNRPYGGFGCAQTANLATMIDNPRQLLVPYDLENAPSARRITVLGKHAQGLATATPRPEGQIVSAGGN